MGRQVNVKPDPSESPIDLNVLDTLRQLDKPGTVGLVEELSSLFLTDTPKRILKMENALRNGDFNTVRTEAHSLKSSSGNLGANQFSKLCKQIENLVITNHLDELTPFIASLVPEFERVKSILE